MAAASDLASLKTKLRAGQDALSKYVFENLSKETQGLLSGNNEAALRSALAKDLNALLDREIEKDPARRKPLYDAERFKGVTLSARTQRFVRQIQEIRANPLVYPNQNIHTPVRLARQLLEEAYPKEMAKSIGGVYPDLEIHTPTNEDSQHSFNDYLMDAQRRLQHDHDRPNEQRQIKPGEDVRLADNKVQVSGQVRPNANLS